MSDLLIKRCPKISDHDFIDGQCIGMEGHEGDHWRYAEDGHYCIWRPQCNEMGCCASKVPPRNHHWVAPDTRTAWEQPRICFIDQFKRRVEVDYPVSPEALLDIMNLCAENPDRIFKLTEPEKYVQS